jgi:hypothetical protein
MLEKFQILKSKLQIYGTTNNNKFQTTNSKLQINSKFQSFVISSCSMISADMLPVS